MNKFISLLTKSESDNGSSQVGKDSILDGSNIELVQDLMPKFSSVVDNESQFEEGCDLSKDSEVLTPLKDSSTLKIQCQQDNISSKDKENICPPLKRNSSILENKSDLQLPLKLLKKNIKIEKD